MFFFCKKHEPSNLVPDFFGETLEASSKFGTVGQKSANVQPKKGYRKGANGKLTNGRQIKKVPRRTLGGESLKEVGKVNPENWIGCKKEYDDLS